MIVDNALYRDGRRVELGCEPGDLTAVRGSVSEPQDFTWVGLHDPTGEELARVAELYGLHELAVEDALSAHQRPKVERYADSMFVVLKTLWYVDAQDAVETGEISLFVGPGFIVTVRHGEGASLTEARRRLEANSHVLVHGPSAVLYAVCDDVVDRYEDVANSLQEDVDEVEESVFSDTRTNDSARIYVLKRELAEMRRAVLPLREPMNRFATGNGVHTEAGPYFRDVADHLARVADTIDTLDSLLSTAFDAHLAQISIQQNDDTRRISAAIGLIAAPTLVAGIYGMNFDRMPELHWLYGYPWALGLMLLSSLTVFLISKRSGWL
ncbi:magnesium/cobalt transporter CorA [Nocardioides aurantiacus]|uniref:Magnesium transport protein CorA n=1 Tax=Nocardioides aurantiacus TaxID=86796 RepID=A0A3N2CT41_9ACTN|nr:magnesium/cobalt transporter CorA [Nocardioides aurantiacus]ROR90699.1 magnesium transporter [Nocardioides aurantiacus]